MCIVLIYSCVSTQNQKTDRQILDLELLAAEKDWNVVEVVAEIISGTSKIISRDFNGILLQLIGNAQIDKILISEIRRFGRSVSDCINFIEFLTEYRISLYIQYLGLKTTCLF